MAKHVIDDGDVTYITDALAVVARQTGVCLHQGVRHVFTAFPKGNRTIDML